MCIYIFIYVCMYVCVCVCTVQLQEQNRYVYKLHFTLFVCMFQVLSFDVWYFTLNCCVLAVCCPVVAELPDV